MHTPLGKLPVMRKAASYIEQARTPLPDRTAKYNLLDRLGVNTISRAPSWPALIRELRSSFSNASGEKSMQKRS